MKKRLAAGVAAGALAAGAAGVGIWISQRDSSPKTSVAAGPNGSTSTTRSTAAPAHIKIAGGVSGTSANASRDAAAPTAGGAAGTALMPIRPVTYVMSGTLPALDGAASAWTVSGTVSTTALRTLATALGVAGEPVKTADGYVVGPADYSGPSVRVFNGSPFWSYSSTQAVSGVGCAEPGRAGATSTGGGSAPDDASASTTVAEKPPVDTPSSPCTTPAPPEGVPSAAQAEAKARDLLKAAGYDLTGWTVTVAGDEYGRYVTAVPALDGVAVDGLTLSIGYGAQGALSWASGVLGTPVKADSYPRIGTTAAFALLQKGEGVPWMYATDVAVGASGATTGSGGGPVMTAGIAVGEPNPNGTASTAVATNVSVPPDTAVPSDTKPMPVDTAPGDVVTSGPTPIDSTPPETVAPAVVTITDVKESYEVVMTTDGSIVLVPSYRFIGSDGGWYPVVAVDRSFLDLPATPSGKNTGIVPPATPASPPASDATDPAPPVVDPTGNTTETTVKQ